MTAPEPSDYLLLFAKYPYPGTAKTRLAPRLGRDGAAAFARSALIDTLHLYTTLRTSHVLVWCYAADGQSSSAADVQQLLNEEGLADTWQAWPQVEERDLGARLAAAVQRAGELALNTHTPAFATLIGADCVVLAPEHVAASVAGAKEKRASIFPATDGGYVLLTVELDPASTMDLFKDIRWSCQDTARDQKRQVEKCYASEPHIGDTMPDIDEPDDLRIFEQGSEEAQQRIQSHYSKTWATLQRLQKD